MTRPASAAPGMKSITSSNARLTRPVTGLNLRVPGESRLVRPGRVDDAAQVLQPELPGRRVRHDGLVELEP